MSNWWSKRKMLLLETLTRGDWALMRGTSDKDDESMRI